MKKVCVPKALNDELEASGLRGLEKDAVLQIVDGCLRSKEYSHPVHVKILRKAIHTRHADKVIHYLQESKFFRAASGASFVVGAACRRYEVLCDREGTIDPRESSQATDGGGRWIGEVVFRSIDFEELVSKMKAAATSIGCGKSIDDAIYGLEHCDLITLSDAEIMEGATAHCLAERPTASKAKIAEVCAAHRSAYLRYVEDRTGGITRQNGRTYSAVSSLPRWIRRLIVRFHGASATVDVSACYPWLVGALHRQRLLRKDESAKTESVDQFLNVIRSGQLYQRLADAAGMPYVTAGEQRAVKAQTQMFCLFGRIGFHPLWHALQQICPGVSSDIRWWRNQSGGATRLANRLQRLEGALMTDGIVNHMTSLSVPCVQIHDAVIVPVDYADQAAGWLRDYSRTLYGTECRAKIEIAA